MSGTKSTFTATSSPSLETRRTGRSLLKEPISQVAAGDMLAASVLDIVETKVSETELEEGRPLRVRGRR